MRANQKEIIGQSGEKIAVYDWLYTQRTAARGAILFVHSFGEYTDRHERQALKFISWGFMVRGFDLHGHGRSGGKRGQIQSQMQYQQDLADVIADWRRDLGPDLPLIVYGNLFGAAIAMTAEQGHLSHADAYFFTSPVLHVRLTRVQRLMLTLARKFAPQHLAKNAIRPELYSRDENVVLLIRSDPQWLPVISVRVADYIAQTCNQALASASTWHKPTLMLYGKDSHLIDTGAIEEFVANTDKLVESKRFDGHFADLFNDLENGLVYKRLQQWLDKKFPPKT